MLDKNIGVPLVNTSTSQVPEVFPEPDSADRTAEYVDRIADLEETDYYCYGTSRKICRVVPEGISLLED
jgi:hypothetical protein